MGKRKAKKRKAEYAPTVLIFPPSEDEPVSVTRVDIKRMATGVRNGWLMTGKYDIDFKGILLTKDKMKALVEAKGGEFDEKYFDEHYMEQANLIDKGEIKLAIETPSGSISLSEWIYIRSVDSLKEVDPAISSNIESAEMMGVPISLIYSVVKFRVVDSKTGLILKVTKPIKV